MISDFTNGLFELVAAILQILSIISVLEHKEVKGVSVFPITFFTLWGAWNLFFYPYHQLWYSFWGGLVMFSVNVVYIGLLIKYGRK